ncbi:MAG TPA: tetratricopeptide repeat protein, partial [Solirubrobacteraceae bacterium]|nr:tetratricopeptide repeat protein [Solirubrobacteraceae bacterium]
FDLAVIETAAGDRLAAHRALDRAVRRQPANPQTWTRLAEFDYTQLNNPTAALNNLRPALYLDPRSYQVEGEVLAVVRRLAMPNPPPATAPSATTPPTATPPTTAPPTATPPSTATP